MPFHCGGLGRRGGLGVDSRVFSVAMGSPSNLGSRVAAVESDCLRATQLVSGEQVSDLQGPIIRDIVALSERIGCTRMFKWIPRSCNGAANCLAKTRLRGVISDFVSVSCPAWLVQCIQRDANTLL